mmetsp:Transcript_62227/g.135920  ORF Transcript_62227/g.135920 Transcript_62227/m.135920 type:complete len:113 (+) Transcript_62227:380-718(+)
MVKAARVRARRPIPCSLPRGFIPDPGCPPCEAESPRFGEPENGEDEEDDDEDDDDEEDEGVEAASLEPELAASVAVAVVEALIVPKGRRRDCGGDSQASNHSSSSDSIFECC